MLIVITGLDGSGTSTIGEKLHELDKGSYLFKTPSKEYSDRNIIDDKVRKDSSMAHMLYYLSSTVYMSDYIKNHCDIENNNVYVIRYFIDTVVSNRVSGINLDLNYNVYGHEILKPDLTLFIDLDEKIRNNRITNRGKSELDKVLDDRNKRIKFLNEFKNLLIDSNTIYVDNSSLDVDQTVNDTFNKIKLFEKDLKNIKTKKL